MTQPEPDLRAILERSRTVATVGASGDLAKAAGDVPKFLKGIGFRVIPVNPNTPEVLGERTHPTLLDIKEPVDVVQVFRPADKAPEIARQAVQIGARTLWLQLGIKSREAREIAEEAGLEYVEDRCMEQESKRFGIRKIGAVREMRLVVTAADYDEAVHFYRDVLGLTEVPGVVGLDGGRVTILEAGRATLELADPVQAEAIDRVEVGKRVAGQIRVAFQVDDSERATKVLAEARATVLAEPVRTPWKSLNARLEAPAGLQLTLFAELDESP